MYGSWLAPLNVCDLIDSNCEHAIVLALAERTQNGHLRESLPPGYATFGQCKALLALYKNGSSYLPGLARGKCVPVVTCLVVSYARGLHITHRISLTTKIGLLH